MLFLFWKVLKNNAGNTAHTVRLDRANLIRPSFKKTSLKKLSVAQGICIITHLMSLCFSVFQNLIKEFYLESESWKWLLAARTVENTWSGLDRWRMVRSFGKHKTIVGRILTYCSFHYQYKIHYNSVISLKNKNSSFL